MVADAVRSPMRLLVLSCAAMVAFALVARTADASIDGSAFMKDLGHRVLALVDSGQPEPEREQQFRKLVQQAFDVPAITRWVLGPYWRTATAAQREEFGKSFENYMLRVYWSRFSTYHGETFRVLGQRSEGDGTILVRTEVLRPGGNQSPVKVSWRLIRRDGTFKIRDVSVAGVSQAETYRDEFTSIIDRNGGQVSALIDALNRHAES